MVNLQDDSERWKSNQCNNIWSARRKYASATWSVLLWSVNISSNSRSSLCTSSTITLKNKIRSSSAISLFCCKISAAALIAVMWFFNLCSASAQEICFCIFTTFTSYCRTSSRGREFWTSGELSPRTPPTSTYRIWYVDCLPVSVALLVSAAASISLLLAEAVLRRKAVWHGQYWFRPEIDLCSFFVRILKFVRTDDIYDDIADEESMT